MFQLLKSCTIAVQHFVRPQVIYVHGKERIEAFLRQDPILHMFALGDLVGIAGVHYWSPAYRIALLGNIATHPQLRRQGIAAAVTARLCQSLANTVDRIGLIVHAENAAARSCYAKLGFVQHSTVDAYSLELKAGSEQ